LRGPRSRSAPRKVCYTVPELAEMVGMSRYRMRNLLDANGVELKPGPPAGRHPASVVVWTSSLVEKLPELLHSSRLVGRGEE
jgi:peroxiredoxin